MTTQGSQGARRADGRHGPRKQNPALCCECGMLRTVAATYYGKAPRGAELPEAGRWLNWLKCRPCGRVTLHAEIRDESWDSSLGCAAERDNREQTVARAELAAILLACASHGITVEWVEDLPQWEKRKQSPFRIDRIVAEVDRHETAHLVEHHVRLIERTPPTQVVGALRKITNAVANDEINEGRIRGFCGCGWDVYVCSYCPGEGWRWQG